ncbi:UNVERIFIED_CONTAM: hypothetical protein FKN15_012373 [Acipenser sinensis]
MAATMWLHGTANMKITEGLIAVLQRDRPEHLPAVLASYREHGVVSSQSESALGGLIGISNAQLGSIKTSAGARLVQFSSSLCRLFAQTLSAWSPACDTTLPGQQRTYSALRVQLYNTLELWVKVGGASSGVLQGTYHHADVLLAHLIGDITTGTDTVKLRAGKSSPELAGHAGKVGGRRSKGSDLSEVGTQLQRKQDAGANRDTALSAVTALSQIVLTSGTLLKEEIHKKLQELLIPLLVRLQQQGLMGGPGGQLTSPYSSPPARRALYHLLLSLVLAPSPQRPPPLHCGVRLFSQGLGDPSVELDDDDDDDDDIIDEDEMGEGVCLGVPGAVAGFALERIEEEEEEEEERGNEGGSTALEEGKGDMMSSQQEGQGKQEAAADVEGTLAQVREEEDGGVTGGEERQEEEVPEQEGVGPEQQEVLVMSQGEVEENQEVIAAVSQIQIEAPPQEVEMGPEGARPGQEREEPGQEREEPGQLQEEEGAAGKLPEEMEMQRQEVRPPRDGGEGDETL